MGSILNADAQYIGIFTYKKSPHVVTDVNLDLFEAFFLDGILGQGFEDLPNFNRSKVSRRQSLVMNVYEVNINVIL